jgi:uncharacterized protein YeaO (DUF488 family)
MPLRTKCILAPPSEEDGTRISVMSRHTLNDGKTPHPDITISTYDEWLPGLAPHPRLVGRYYRQEISFEELAEAYRLVARDSPEVLKLAERALTETITVMCIEDGCGRCNRRILAEECQRLVPLLEVELA